MIVRQTCISRAHQEIYAEIKCLPCEPAPHQQRRGNTKATPTSAVVKSSSRAKMFWTDGCFCLASLIAGQIAANFSHNGLRVEKKKSFSIIFPFASLSSSRRGCLRGGQNILNKQINEILWWILMMRQAEDFKSFEIVCDVLQLMIHAKQQVQPNVT